MTVSPEIGRSGWIHYIFCSNNPFSHGDNGTLVIIPVVRVTTDGPGLNRRMRGLVVHRTTMGVVATITLDPDGLGVLYALRLTIMVRIMVLLALVGLAACAYAIVVLNAVAQRMVLRLTVVSGGLVRMKTSVRHSGNLLKWITSK
jgi:hypothetical protein